MGYIWYGTEWLSLRDLENSMSMDEAVAYSIVSRIPMIPLNEIPYLSGEKDNYKRQLGFFIGITRVLKNDHTKKYKNLLEKRKVLQFDPDTLTSNQSYSHIG